MIKYAELKGYKNGGEVRIFSHIQIVASPVYTPSCKKRKRISPASGVRNSSKLRQSYAQKLARMIPSKKKS